MVGYSPWGCKESYTTEQLTLNTWITETIFSLMSQMPFNLFPSQSFKSKILKSESYFISLLLKRLSTGFRINPNSLTWPQNSVWTGLCPWASLLVLDLWAAATGPLHLLLPLPGMLFSSPSHWPNSLLLQFSSSGKLLLIPPDLNQVPFTALHSYSPFLVQHLALL